MNNNDKAAHIFLTGNSINLYKSFDLISSNDLVITTNLAVLNKFIARRAQIYFLANSARKVYRKPAELCIKLAEGNVSSECEFYLNSSLLKYAKSQNDQRKINLLPSNKGFKFVDRNYKLKSSTQYAGIYLLSKLGFKNIYLWGADYILEKPCLSHFYNFNIFFADKPDKATLRSYKFIKNYFHEISFFHVCSNGSKSALFETINI